MWLQMALFHSFLLLSNNPLCVCIPLRVHTHTPHILFIHSSGSGHLVYFYVLAIVNAAAMNNEMYVSFELEFLSFPNICPGVILLGHVVTLFLVFKGIVILSSMVATPMYIPTKSVGGLPFLLR